MYFFCRSYFSLVWESPKGNIRTKWPRPNIPLVTTLMKFTLWGPQVTRQENFGFSVFVGELHSEEKKFQFFWLQREMNALEMLCPLLSTIRNTILSINGIALLHLLWSFFLHVSPFSPFPTIGTCQVSPFLSLSLVIW